MSEQPITRRRFLRQSFAFSAALAASGTLAGCGSGIVADTAVDASPALHIGMVGDWGDDDTIVNQQDASNGLQAFLKAHTITDSYMLMLGDNFYGPLTGVNDRRWEQQFEQMYPVTAVPGNCWAVLGNHEYQTAYVGKKEIEFAYSARGDSRWTMPNNFYRVDLPIKAPLVTFLFLDSNVQPAGPLDPNFFFMSESDRQVQLAWLEAELAKPKVAPFTAVVAHHPLYSNGPHGDNGALLRDWEPLFRKYKVNLYLAGHDHDLQHLEFAGHPTSFASSGGGGASLYKLQQTQDKRGPFAQSVFGSSFMTITPDHITFRHLDIKGTVIHSFRKALDGSVIIRA